MMKPHRYVPHEDTQSVTIAVQATDTHVVVTSDGYETCELHEQLALDAHPSVKREALAPAPAKKGDKS